jgi:hypothetical protein
VFRRRRLTQPALKLDDTIHQRLRLGILAVLSEASGADCSFLRDSLDLTDGYLSRHVSVLEEAGLDAPRRGGARRGDDGIARADRAR